MEWEVLSQFLTFEQLSNDRVSVRERCNSLPAFILTCVPKLYLLLILDTASSKTNMSGTSACFLYASFLYISDTILNYLLYKKLELCTKDFLLHIVSRAALANNYSYVIPTRVVVLRIKY